MYILESVFRFLAVSSIWISISASCGTIVLGQIYSIPVAWWQPLAAGLATFAVYSLDKVGGSKEDRLNTPERAWLARYPIKKIALLAYLAAIILVSAIDFWRLPAILSFGFAGWVYTRRVRGMRLKDIPTMKNVIVALATAICYAGLLAAPIQAYIMIFLMIFVGTVIFDLRDMKGDAASGVKTIPVICGRALTIAIIAMMSIVIFAMSHAMGLVALATIAYFSIKRSNIEYDLICDGWFIWLLLLI